MARARVQHRHGTFSNYENNKTTILNDEIVVVDSGHPDTPDGSALYYRPSGASEPVRVANAGELTESGINVETVTESQLNNATGDNIYLCLINGRWHKVICVSGSSTRAHYAVSAYHNFIYRWQSKSGDSWGRWTDWSPIGVTDNIRDGAIKLSKLGTDVLEQLANKENTANKVTAITEENKTSKTLFPTVGAVNEFVSDKIAAINSMIGDLEARISNLE